MSLVLLDTNVLVHAAYRGSPLHPIAAWLVSRALSVAGAYCIAPQNLVEFAAVTSRSRFVAPPLPGFEIARMCQRLHRSRRLKKIYPKRSTVLQAIQEGSRLGIVGPRFYDLYLAMTMHDAEVEDLITDNVKDFARIPFVNARALRDVRLAE